MKSCLKKNNLKQCIICFKLSSDKHSIFCLNENKNGKLTCPINNYNYLCYQCSNEWVKNTNSCPICRSENINFIEQISNKNNIDIENNEEPQHNKKCSSICINSIYPNDFLEQKKKYLII